MKYCTTLFCFSIFSLLLFRCSPAEKKEMMSITGTPGVGEQLVKLHVGSPQEGKEPLFIDQKGDTLTSQLVKSGPGTGMEYLAMLDFELDSLQSLEIAWVEENAYPQFSQKTQVRIGHSEAKDKAYQALASHIRPKGHVQGDRIYQAEGPIWENELVGFRTYFDPRNGKDIFGKAQHQLCADRIGVDGNYHELQDWGMDILKVGKSLGAGALAILKNDSLHRLGDTERAEAKILDNGALMSRLLLDYDGWEVAGKVYDVEERISIYAGKRFYESEVTLQNGTAQDTLVTGIVDLHDLEAKSFAYNGFHVYYTHGQQSYINDFLGMAVIVPQKHFAGFAAAPKAGEGITNTHTAYLTPAEGKYRFSFYVGWEKENPGFKDESFFVGQIRQSIDQMNIEMTVNWN